MKALEALKKADKIIPTYEEKGRFSNILATLDDDGVLFWCDDRSGHLLEIVALEDIEKHNWQPIDESIIRPKVDEVWEDASGTKWLISLDPNNSLRISCAYINHEVSDKMAHGHYGWKRIFPFVPDDKDLLMNAFDSVIDDLTKAAIGNSIEVVEIDNVDCKSSSSDNRIFKVICEKPEFGPILPLKRYDKVIFIRTKK